MKIFHHVDKIDIEKDLWQVLAEADKPIVMYGMGNGADKILDVFSKKGISVADFFASDGFVRYKQFHGKTVVSYSDVCEKYDDFIVVVSFGSNLPEVLENIYRLDAERELYVPDVPVVGGSEIFDLEYFKAHKDELCAACGLFEDELSRQTFCDVVLFRLTGKLEYLRRHEADPREVMEDLLGAHDFCETADLGAYNGDSIRELAGYAPNLSRVTAFEPDGRTFRKLTAYASESDIGITAHNCAAWNEDCTLVFTEGGNRNSTVASDEGIKTGAKLKEIAAARLDSIYSGRCDYIKYDVEGAEYEAILGSRETIVREHPKLLISLYHRSCDIFRLPILLKEMGYTGLYLRRYKYVPAWDLNLICVD